jgi:hypothetical protein
MLTPLTTDEVITVSFALDQLRSPSQDLPGATLTYLVGRHTGVLTFLPIVPALVGAGIYNLVRSRAHRRSVSESGGLTAQDDTDVAVDVVVGQERDAVSAVPSMAWAGVAGLLLYAGFYLLLFTNNYYGGGQSIGSRYFLQFSTIAVVVPVAAGISSRAVHRCAAFAGIWALVVLGPHLLNADTAFVDLWRTSSVQRFLPYDGTQDYHEQWPP